MKRTTLKLIKTDDEIGYIAQDPNGRINPVFAREIAGAIKHGLNPENDWDTVRLGNEAMSVNIPNQFMHEFRILKTKAKYYIHIKETGKLRFQCIIELPEELRRQV